MRTTKSLLLTLALALFTAFAFAQSMAGTAHDFSDETWAGGAGDGSNSGRTCVVCHIAHNSSATIDAPLWNREDPAVVQANFSPYTSATFDAASGSIVGSVGSNAVFTPDAWADYLADDGSTNGTGQWTPDGSSVLCLSCHDGVGNLDAFGGTSSGSYAIATGTTVIAAEGDRSNGQGEHPYSFSYTDALVSADTEGGIAGLKAPSTLNGTVLLENNKIQCSTCHDVHNSYTNDFLLTLDNAGSALCRSCHTK